jgi:hypothetical protein
VTLVLIAPQPLLYLNGSILVTNERRLSDCVLMAPQPLLFLTGKTDQTQTGLQWLFSGDSSTPFVFDWHHPTLKQKGCSGSFITDTSTPFVSELQNIPETKGVQRLYQLTRQPLLFLNCKLFQKQKGCSGAFINDTL